MTDFPSAPTPGQTFTAGSQSWTWDGEKWVASTGATASSVQSVAGKTGVVTLVHTDITDWAASVPIPYTLPQATTSVLGGVKVDGSTIIAASGVISASASGLADAPNDATAYARKSAAWAHLTHNDITDWSANVPAPYVLPQATTTTLGGVKVDGSTITIAGGVISSVSGYTLPQATTSVLGGVKVDGTTITAASGVISSSGVMTFNTRSGAVALVSGDVTAALGFTPYNTTNPSGYQTAAQVTASLGAYLPLAGGALGGGISFGNNFAASPADLSKHIALFGTSGYGFSITSGRLNINGGSIVLGSGAVDYATFGSTGPSVVGNTTGSNAGAGIVGEVISSNVTTPVTMTTATGTNIASISLTAGDWDVSGEVWFVIGAGGATQIQGAISSVSATNPSLSAVGTSRTNLSLPFPASTNQNIGVRTCRVSLAATTTYYLVSVVSFPSGTCTAAGNIWARRAR